MNRQSRSLTYLEHAQDVLEQWLAWRRSDAVALIVVTTTEGGAVRLPGSLMAISASGGRCGYISGGCIDSDIVNHALDALHSGRVRHFRYGNGSPFIDMPLPCGGAIELCILPDAEIGVLRACHDRLASRRAVTLNLSTFGDLSLRPSTESAALSFHYVPKLHLRIAGRGADCLALARLAVASGIQTELQIKDSAEVRDAERFGVDRVTNFTSLSSLPYPNDDPWTAFLLAFHDLDWEEKLLAQALKGLAFYIGAVGSKATHARRCARLRAAGFAEKTVNRIHGPVGLIPSMRDASSLAISVLAEIVQAYQSNVQFPAPSAAIVSPVVGQSSRF